MPTLPAIPEASPPPLASLDRAFEVFRVCWRRAAFAQLALALVTLAATAWFTALLSLGGAAAAIHFTRSGGGWTARMVECVSAHAWHTKGRVEPSGTLAALRILSWFTLFAIFVDLGTAVAGNIFGWNFSYGFIEFSEMGPQWTQQVQCLGNSYCQFMNLPGGSGSVTATYDSSQGYCVLSGQIEIATSWGCPGLGPSSFQALFVLSFLAYPMLAVHLCVSFFSLRAWVRDACDWLELLPRPAAPVAIQWDTVPAESSSKWAAQPLIDASLARGSVQ
jgi:hypothetical protein